MLLSLLSKRYFYDDSRDAYGFTVRPQHIQTYREYSNIYKEEEDERLRKWKDFLQQQPRGSTGASSCSSGDNKPAVSEDIEQPSDLARTDRGEGESSAEERPRESQVPEKESEPLQSVTAEVNDTREEGVLSGNGDDSSTGKKLRDSEVAEKEREPVPNVSTEEVNGTRDYRSAPSGETDDLILKPEVAEIEAESIQNVSAEATDTREASLPPKAAGPTNQDKFRQVKTWVNISPSLHCIGQMMGERVKKKKNKEDEKLRYLHNDHPSINGKSFSGEPKDDNKGVFNDNEDSAHNTDELLSSTEPCFPWKELECLVQGGVPKDLRGEVWQAFVGVRTRRVKRYYQDLLAIGCDYSESQARGPEKVLSGDNTTQKICDLPEMLKKQIEKDLTRTFPGHPALNDNGRNSLRRVLWAYARHNPSVGYCQAMNFFAGLLLLMMPEENAFWTLVGIIDDYFEGYFSQDMIESQVDQLVLEDLMRERFPKLVNHLNCLGVEVAWVSGSWFLSIFVNILPWESVLRMWDVMLFQGNRVMLFRTALALMDLYGPALGTTKDAGDAITLLQTLTGSTFDSSQLVMTACMGFLTVTEDQLNELRDKHRPSVLASIEERAKGSQVFKDPKGLATKLYSFKQDPRSIVKESRTESSGGSGDHHHRSIDARDSPSANLDELLQGITIDSEIDSLPDLQEQVIWLKVELCRLLEEKRSAVLRAEELEAAFMEIVQEDNRRELSAMVEQLEQEVSDLQQALADKEAAEQAMLQVLMKVEQEQRVAEDARRCAEQEAADQRRALQVLEEQCQKATAALAEMEERAVMAESLLESTIPHDSAGQQGKPPPTLASPRSGPRDASKPKSSILSFSLGNWRDRSKAQSSNDGDSKHQDDGSDKTHLWDAAADSSDHPK